MALEGGEGTASCSGRSLPPGKTQYQLYRRLSGPQGQSGQVWKTCPPPVFDPRTVQPVASCYTDWATRPTGYNIECKKMHSRNTIKFFRTNVWILVFLSLTERLHSTVPSLCNILQLTIRLHVLNSVSVEFLFFIKSQFTTTGQNVHLNQCTCGHTDGHKTWEVPERLQTVWKASTMCWWSASSFSIAAEYNRGFKWDHRNKA
jgi:hypothetical protein